MTSILIIIALILFLILILLFLDIHLEIYNISQDTDIHIKYGFVKFHLDYDKYVRKYSVDKDLKDIIGMLQSFHKNKKIIFKLFKAIRVDDFLIEIKNKSSNNLLLQYLNATSLILLSYLKSYLENNIKQLNNYDAKIVNEDSILDKKIEVDYHLEFKVNLKDILLNMLRRNKYEPSHS